MKRYMFFAYGVICHLLFLGTYLWMAAFVGNLVGPWTIDVDGAGFGWTALAINLSLIVVFGLQHSVMARPTFKKHWTKIVPTEIERSTYVLITCVLLVGLMAFWQPMGPIVWDAQGTLLEPVLWGLFACGILMVPLASLLISHFDLFGSRQVWLQLKKKPYTHLPYRTPSVYKRVRHPLYVGWMVFFWAAPTMTAGHLLLASTMTLYMVVAIYFEERNLVEVYGDKYRQYQKDVPAFIPRPGRKAAPVQEGGTVSPALVN